MKLKTNWSIFFLGSLISFAPTMLFAQSLQPLSEEELGAVTGQKGILVSMEYYFNSSPDDDSNTGFNEAGAPIAGADGCSTPNGGSSLENMNCRFGIQLKNRETEWLVAKNGYASLVVNKLSLDASKLNESRGSSKTGWFDPATFQDPDHNCLLETGCSAASIAALAGLRTSYPNTGGSYDSSSKTVTGYSDARFGMYFEGLAVEPNSAVNVQDGWSRGNINGSFMGLKIADNNGYQAGIAFGGDFYMYGF
ncbi:hypothetical protein A11A3_10601 [Alcanivorax hongdengensis A-11-3]|uniref:Uncharacterized protein n=1 Tax=Alcanivorax hongdengensis A-11-3 TaxID=1177179 RepID=L0WD99_9GAMM|nr:hypothetical protein [Alcanivorax hongdengensis]EKF74102.1 hypothetical protein A11A3_10601 [Alcanivorax hongdengensis A-11-3]